MFEGQRQKEKEIPCGYVWVVGVGGVCKGCHELQ